MAKLFKKRNEVLVMWCPKCKNEYVPGITKCTDCDVDLVESLEAYESAQAQTSVNETNHPFDDIDEDFSELKDAEKFIFSTASHAYVPKKLKTEDIKSTAYTFTLVGITGIIIVILFAAGILPLHTASYMKVIISVVMGALFAIFLYIGIRSFGQIKTVTAEADSEETFLSEALEWFRTNYDRTVLDADTDTDEPEETLYFSRYEKMRNLFLLKYPDIEETLLDHIIETLYSEIF